MRNKWIGSLLGVAFLSTSAQAVLIADFEPPTYTADTEVNGADGWVGGAGLWVSPRDGVGYTAAYGAVIQGSQSLFVGGGDTKYSKPVPSGLVLGDGSTLSYLYWQEGVYGGEDNPGSAIGLADASDTVNPIAAVGINGLGHFTLIGSGGWASATDTGITAPTGTSANAKHVRVDIVFDQTDQQFEAFYTQITPTLGTTVSLGVKALGATLNSPTGTPANTPVFYVVRTGGASWYAIDDVNLVAVPEPSSVLGMAGLCGIAALRRRRV